MNDTQPQKEPFYEIARRVVPALGVELLGYLTREEPGVIESWIEPRLRPPVYDNALRTADSVIVSFRKAGVLQDEIRRWFRDTNPYLNGRAPIADLGLKSRATLVMSAATYELLARARRTP